MCEPGQALPKDSRLVACERDERPLELARRAWHDAGVAHKVKPCCGPLLLCRMIIGDLHDLGC